LKGQKVMLELFLLNELPEQVRNSLTANPDHICHNDSDIYYFNGQHVIKFSNDQMGNELLYSMMSNPYLQSGNVTKAAELYRQILTDTLPGSLQETLNQYDIISTKRRYIIVFRSFFSQKNNLFSAFSAMVPLEPQDVIIPIRFDTVVLVKDASMQTIEDISEYSSAVIDTLEDEGFGCVKAGMGHESSDISTIRDVYLEAQRAIDLGMRYHGSEKVFLLSQMTLEMIIDSIPAERREQIKHSFFHMSANGEMSDELLETVKVFFRNDLNMTATSKQLFIHRNTLNYRLDKIHKLFNLDVRSFQDAVVFKIITDFPDYV